jgi:hypothetical protein
MMWMVVLVMPMVLLLKNPHRRKGHPPPVMVAD